MSQKMLSCFRSCFYLQPSRLAWHERGGSDVPQGFEGMESGSGPGKAGGEGGNNPEEVKGVKDQANQVEETIENAALVEQLTKAYEALKNGDGVAMLRVVLDNKGAIETILNSWAGNLLPESLKSSVKDFLALSEKALAINDIVQKEGVGLENFSKIIELGEGAAKDYMNIVRHFPQELQNPIIKATKDYIMEKVPNTVPNFAKTMIRSKLDSLLPSSG